MAGRKLKARGPRVVFIDEGGSVGPPDILAQTITLPNGTVLRDPLIQPHLRPDMDNIQTRGAKIISGWRRTWTIDRLHTSSPNEITGRHVHAARRLTDDYEASQGAITGGRPPSGSDIRLDPVEVRIIATKKYEAAMEAIGLEDAYIVYSVVIRNQSMRWIEARMTIDRNVAMGRFISGLTRLRDHYSPPTRSATVASMMELAIDAKVRDVPQERLGRQRVAA